MGSDMYELRQSTAFEKWITNLRDRAVRQVIAGRLIRPEGGSLGDSKLLGHGIRELRIHVGPGYRIYFTVRRGEIILLLCGGDKSTQPKDIDRARSIAEAWEV